MVGALEVLPGAVVAGEAMLPLRPVAPVEPVTALEAVAAVLPVAAIEAVLALALLGAELVGLRLAGDILVACLHRAIAAVARRVVVAVIVEGTLLVGAAELLAELLLRRRDDAVVVLGVLVIVLGRDRVAARLRVAGELGVFVGDVLGGAPDLHIRTVRFVAPRQGIGTLGVAVAPTHAPVLLWSHRIYFRPSLALNVARNAPGRPERARPTVRVDSMVLSFNRG